MNSPLPPKKHFISWHDFQEDTLTLAHKLPQKSWEGIIAITRGGLIPAALIAHHLSITLIETLCLSSYDDTTHKQSQLRILKDISPCARQNWLVIDDLIDTGKTINMVRKMVPGAYCAAVYGKSHGLHLIDAFAKEINAWIVFPWEMDLDNLKQLGRC